MSYRARSSRRLVKKTRRNILTTIIICTIILYVTIAWILPNLIGALGIITGFFKPSGKATQSALGNTNLAPPVLNIPYEATNSAQIDISGYSTSGSKVEIYIDDELKTTATVSEDGTFTARNIDLNLGTNNIYGKTLDLEEKSSLSSKTIKLIYDADKPSLDISEPTDGATTKDRKIKVSGNTEPGVQITINGNQIIINSDGNFSNELSLNDGENTLSIKATDNASNFTEVTRKVTYQP